MRRIDAPAARGHREPARRRRRRSPGRVLRSGPGLLLAAELDGVEAPAVYRQLLDRGLVVNAVTPTALRLAPPITVSDAEIDEAVGLLAEVLHDVPRPQAVAAPRSLALARSCLRRGPCMTRHLLDVADLTADEVRSVLDLAVVPPAALGRPLDGQGVALIFEKPSARTRQSMEMAVVQLGGHPVYTQGEEIGIDVREPVEDVTRILQGYHAVIAARVFAHELLERMVAGRRRADREHALRPCAPAPGARRRAHDGATTRPAGRPDDRVGRRLQQRRPVARRDRARCSVPICATPVRSDTTRTRPRSSD